MFFFFGWMCIIFYLYTGNITSIKPKGFPIAGNFWKPSILAGNICSDAGFSRPLRNVVIFITHLIL